MIRGALLGRTIGGNGQSRDDGVALLLALLAWLLVAGGLYFLFRLSGLFVRQDKRLARSR